MSQTGETLVTDGEPRARSFAPSPIIDSLGGKGLADNLAADGQYFVRVSPSAPDTVPAKGSARRRAALMRHTSGDLRRRPSSAVAASQERSVEVQHVCL